MKLFLIIDYCYIRVLKNCVCYLICAWKPQEVPDLGPVFLCVQHPLVHHLLPESHNCELTVKKEQIDVLIHLLIIKVSMEKNKTTLTQHIASCICSSASRRPMHILFPIPKGTCAKGLMEVLFSSQRSGLNWFPLSKYSSLEPKAWLLIIKTVCTLNKMWNMFKIKLWSQSFYQHCC